MWLRQSWSSGGHATPASVADVEPPTSIPKEDAASRPGASSSPPARPPPATPQTLGPHVIFGGIERLHRDAKSSSASTSSSAAQSSSRSQERKSGPGRGDLARLKKWRINPANIHFKQVDLTPESSSLSQSSSNCTRSKSAEPPRTGALEAPVSADRLKTALDVVGATDSNSRQAAASSSAPPPDLAAQASAGGAQAAAAGAADFDWALVDSESEVDNNGLTATDRRQQELAQQQGFQLLPADFDLSKVPLNADGEPSSIGAIGHAAGECKACIFFISPTGCSNGIMCSFCHLPHKSSKRKNKMRPCKGKRDRYRKLLFRLAQQVEQDPDGFCVDNVELPPSITSNESTKTKLIARMEMLKEQVKAQQSAASAGGASSSSAQLVPTPLLLSQFMQTGGGVAASAPGRPEQQRHRRKDATSIVSL